jgi:hypothetical protein
LLILFRSHLNNGYGYGRQNRFYQSKFYIYSMRFIAISFLFVPLFLHAQLSQDSAAFFIRDIYRQSYTEEISYQWLTTLTKDIGPRLSGSEGAANAVQWTKHLLDSIGMDSVWLQECLVPKWVRGEKEQVTMTSAKRGSIDLSALALGNSPGTGTMGVKGEVIEVKTLDELREIPEEKVKGKIVFFNRPMDPGLITTGAAYGGAVDQRGNGPIVAAEKGAIAAVVRSMTTRLDDFPHTGATNLSTTVTNIPSVAISTLDAEYLHAALCEGPVNIFIRTTSQMLPDVISHNVIGEIKGSEFPNEIILVGGHLDSWDVGEGAHDDGCGCIQSVEAVYRLIKNGYKPKRTIRCVLFMNEENGLKGARKYADEAIAKDEFHLAAIEADGGCGTPQAFGCSAGAGYELDKHLAYMSTYMGLLEPYFVQLQPGGGGADIGPLKPTAGLLIGLRVDGSRYFDYHHSHRDVLENVHPRELASGSAALASFIFLIDQYGIGK